MNTFRCTRNTILYIITIISILFIPVCIYIGVKYIDQHFIKNNVIQMISIYHDIPDPVDRSNEIVKIEKRWVVKSLVADRFYHNLSKEDGKIFFTNYAKRSGWKIIENQYYENMKEYYLTIKKGDITCFFIHKEYSDKWRIRIVKNDIFFKLGL